MDEIKYKRSRIWLTLLIVAIIAIGLASRKVSGLFPAALANYPGDALWALTAYLVIAWISPRLSVMQLAGTALVLSFLVELSQLYQAPWINAVRATSVGHLLLGQGFDPLDLLAQTLGVALATIVDGVVSLAARRPRQ